MKKLLVILLFMLGGISYANSQALTQICFRNTNGGCSEVTALNPFPVTGTITASLGGFNLESSLTPLSVTTSSGTSGSFTAGKTLILSNVGTTNTAYCKLGTGATTSSIPILPGQSINLTSVAETTVACITSTSTTTVNVQVGTGLPTGWGGANSSGGGSSAITIASGAVASGAYSSGSIASGAMVDIGSQADAACGTATGTCSLIALQKYNNTAVGSAIPTQAASIPIGGVGIIPNSTNACTPNVASSAASTNATNIKASAGVLCKVSIVNTTTTLYYLLFYNTAGTPTCNTGIVARYPIPPASASGGAGGIAPSLSAFGEAYTTGIGFCITSAADGTGSAATGIYLSYSYQ